MPDVLITDVLLENVEVQYPGGGNPLFAKLDLDSLDLVPERPEAYPDFSMFRELPAWGAYIRHAQDIELRNVSLSAKKKDYRTAVVLDDVRQSRLVSLKVQEVEKKPAVYQHKTTDIVIK